MTTRRGNRLLPGAGVQAGTTCPGWGPRDSPRRSPGTSQLSLTRPKPWLRSSPTLPGAAPPLPDVHPALPRQPSLSAMPCAVRSVRQANPLPAPGHPKSSSNPASLHGPSPGSSCPPAPCSPCPALGPPSCPHVVASPGPRPHANLFGFSFSGAWSQLGHLREAWAEDRGRGGFMAPLIFISPK